MNRIGHHEGDLQEGVLLQQLEHFRLVVKLSNINGRLSIQILQCPATKLSRAELDILLSYWNFRMEDRPSDDFDSSDSVWGLGERYESKKSSTMYS